MLQTDYDNFCKETGAIAMAHPEFPLDFHTELAKEYPVTFLMCQRQTKEYTQLCVESFLRFYPDFKMLIVDDESLDDSAMYLKYKELTTPNLSVYWRSGKPHAHGDMLNEAMTEHITTPYVLMMDSDTITNRGGWIEQMLQKFKENDNLYATGTLMLVTESGEACGAPKDENDILRYAHPSCAMYDRGKYLTLFRATDHGAVLALNMIEAKHKGLDVTSFPIQNYVAHRTGSSWVKEHKIVWGDDYNTFVRPFITLISTSDFPSLSLKNQKDKDFNCVFLGDNQEYRIWETTTRDINNPYFNSRFYINGEYVCEIDGTDIIDENFITNVKKAVIENNIPDELFVGNIAVYRRRFFQNQIALF